MIINLWSQIELYCPNHAEPMLMPIENRRGVIYYTCPHKYEYSTPSERCVTEISLKDFEKILEHLSTVLYEAEIRNEQPNLKGEEFTINKNKCRVIEHGDKIKILVTIPKYKGGRE